MGSHNKEGTHNVTDEQNTTVKGYLADIAPEISQTDNKLLDFTIDEVDDRIRLYLNRDDVPDGLLRIVARVVIQAYKGAESYTANGQEQEVSSITDNGQSVSFSKQPKRYLATASDQEIFSGFAELLKPYRRVNVVT